MVAQTNGIVSGLVIAKWNSDAATMQAVDENWFTTDIKPSQEARKRFALDDAFTVVKHTLQLFVTTDTVVNVQYKFEGQDTPGVVVKVFNLNGGADLVANAPFQFDLILLPGSSYNIQHKTTVQNVAAVIAESFNVDI